MSSSRPWEPDASVIEAALACLGPLARMRPGMPVAGQSIEAYAKTHLELAAAVRKFGGAS